jgi:hypothetical protein
MRKLMLTAVGLAFFGLAQSQSFKFSVGYGFPWLSQEIGTNSSTTHTTTLDINSGLEVPRVTSTRKTVEGSYGAGLNINGAFGYTLSENIGIELGISYLTGRKYTTGSNYTDIRQGELMTFTHESESSTSKAVLFTPMLKFVTHKRNFTPYFLIGPVLGKVNFNRALSRSTEESGATVSEVRNTKFKGGVSIGLRGAVGVSVVLNRKFSVFSEIMFTGMNYFAKESEIVRYTVNGEDKLSLLTENIRKTVYVKEIEIDSDNASDYDNHPGKSLRFPISMSSVGANVGMLVKLN